MLARRAHHVSFCVGDLARARAFYGEVLGLPEIERPNLGVAGVWYRAGDVELHLIVGPEGVDVGRPPPRTTPVAGHLAFEVEDYAAARDALRAAGLDVLETDPRVGQMWVQDPDGHVIELIEPGARRRAASGSA